MTERITARNKEGAYFLGINGKACTDKQGRTYGEAAEKLARYEDLEEQSRLFETKLYIGQKVHLIGDKADEYIVLEVSINKDNEMYLAKSKGGWFQMFDKNDIGKTVFLTKVEAEAKKYLNSI